MAAEMFDEIVVFHTGPGGKRSTDGTIEIAEAAGVRLEWGAIDAGFGVVRTQALRLSTCEWVAVLDADERLWATVPCLEPVGHEAYPAVPVPDLTVTRSGHSYDQRAFLRERISDPGVNGVCAVRRHWFDLEMTRPCQNWRHIPDPQLRILRNVEHVFFTPEPKMHEHVFDSRRGEEPYHVPPHPEYGPYFDHFHMHFKAMEPEQRAADIRVFDALHFGSVPAGDCNAQ